MCLVGASGLQTAPQRQAHTGVEPSESRRSGKGNPRAAENGEILERDRRGKLKLPPTHLPIQTEMKHVGLGVLQGEMTV